MCEHEVQIDLTRVLNSFFDLVTPKFERLVVSRLALFFWLFLALWLRLPSPPVPTSLSMVALVDTSLFLFPTERKAWSLLARIYSGIILLYLDDKMKQALSEAGVNNPKHLKILLHDETEKCKFLEGMDETCPTLSMKFN